MSRSLLLSLVSLFLLVLSFPAGCGTGGSNPLVGRWRPVIPEVDLPADADPELRAMAEDLRKAAESSGFRITDDEMILLRDGKEIERRPYKVKSGTDADWVLVFVAPNGKEEEIRFTLGADGRLTMSQNGTAFTFQRL